MLAAPGMPLHQAPVLTAKQASALMAAICEPLLSLPVGRLTRKLSAPTKLQPTEDRGILSLWLLPDDSLSLVWQSAQQLASAALEDIAGPSSLGATRSRITGSGGSEQVPGMQQSCSVAVWEELAHFPAMAHLLDDAPVVTIHMLRGDASGRSFYIRVRNDVAEANLEAATAAVPDASRLLQQQRTAAAAISGGGGSCYSPAAEEEAAGAPRMYFWLTDRDLGKAVYSLGRLKSLLKRPPTLSKRSGVPERQLDQLGAWVQKADVLAAEQQRQAAQAAAQQLEEEDSSLALPWEDLAGDSQGLAASSAAQYGLPAGLHPASSSNGSNAGNAAAPLSPLLQGPGAGYLLGQGMAAQMQDNMASLLPPAAEQVSCGPQRAAAH